MPDRIKSALVEALETNNGDRNLAAAAMGWPVEKIHYTIRNNKDLRSRWCNSIKNMEDTPTELETINREPVPEMPPAVDVKSTTVSVSDEQLAIELRREDQRVVAGLAKMGLNTEELQEAISLQTFHRDFFKQSIEIVGAGVTKSTIQLRTQIAKIATRLEYVRSVIVDFENVASDERSAFVAEEKDLMDSYLLATQTLSRIYEISMKGAFIMATVRNQQRGIKSLKPGFASSNSL